MASLPFERFRTEGNSPDAVVYLWEEELLKYREFYFKLHKDVRYTHCAKKGIPDDATVMNVARFSSPEHMDRIEVRFHIPTSPRDITSVCWPHFVPDAELKSTLCAMFQRHGSELKAEVQQLERAMECFERIKTIMEKNSKEFQSLCPNLNLAELDVNFNTGISHFPSQAYDFPEPLYEKLEGLVRSISRDACGLETVSEISRKRKNAD